MLNDIYNKKILRFAGNIPRLERLADPDATATKASRTCGSQVSVDITFDGTYVTDFGHDVKACALGQAASSIMARNVIGATEEELCRVRDQMRAMLKDGGTPPDGKWADLAVLAPVADFPARHNSVMLTFDATCAAIADARTAGRTRPLSVSAG